MKKICHMSSVHKGLDVRIFHKECCSLANNSYEVSLVINANESDRLIAKSNNVSLYPLRFEDSRFKRIFVQNYRCFITALKTKSDIYHFHDPELIPFGVLLSLFGKKVIYDVHEDVPLDILNKSWIPILIRKLLSKFINFIEKFASKFFFQVIAATPHISTKFLAVNPQTINVNNYPLSKDIPEVINETGEVEVNEICYIGGITQMRGIEEIILALDQTEEDVILNLAGNFLDKDYELKLQKHSAWKKVNYYGYVDREDIRKILARSSLGLVTLYPTNTYMESLPVKMFEYMAYGLPVIASDFALWRKIIKNKDCGLLVNPKSSGEIAKAIDYCIRNRERTLKMGKNARKAILEEYNWNFEEEKLLKFYKELSNL